MRPFFKLKRAARRMVNRFRSRAIILLYHRVTGLPSDPQLLSVNPRHFDEHLQILRQHGEPMHLNDLNRKQQRRPAFIVTFDDGYADNLENAKPLLARQDIPATVFIATGYIGSQREFWKDYLERIFLQPGTLPSKLRLSMAGAGGEWELGESRSYSIEDYRAHSRWNITSTIDPTVRQRLYRALCQLLSPLPDDERRNTIEELLSWAGSSGTARPSHRTLSASEISTLADGGLIDIGAHSVCHPVLSKLSPPEQCYEVEQSKLRLEEILGRQVASFAYPYGGRSHYTSDTIAAVRAAGFARACANFPGAVRRDSDNWQLPRFLVRDWPGEEFARRLREWLSE
jgi:peptidoglycan/xylan/chitin deacetylase (PgdA/CDA1 family)